MNKNVNPDSLGNLIRTARNRRNLKLEAVIEGRSRQWLHNIETGSAFPTPEALVQLHQELIGGKVATPRDSLAYWLLKLAEEKIPGDDLSNKLLVQAELGKLLELERRRFRSSVEGPRTLEFFPEAFSPVTVICGDRREPTPKTRGDLFAYSVSITDLTFILQLGLPEDTRIRTDKLCVLLSKESLKRLFGNSHLLVLGSPAVNFASRILNNHSLFRFDLGPEIKLWEKHVGELTHLRQREHLRIFAHMMKNPERISLNPADYDNTSLSAEEVTQLAKDVNTIVGMKPERALLNEFRQAGLIDPADQRIHGKSTHEDNDFGLISIAKNPYAEPDSDFVAILAAGIHGPGSVQAVKALASKDKKNTFGSHPFGGILEIQLNWSEQWSDRLENATWRWQTGGYSPSKLVKNLEAGLPDFASHESARATPPLSPEEITNCIALLNRLNSVT